MQDIQAGTSSVAEIATPLARRYMTQLCKHFEHRLAVTHDEASGDIAFSIGHCRLRAGPDLLTLTVQAVEPGKLAELQDVVARHLVRFAFREEMQVEWRAA